MSEQDGTPQPEPAQHVTVQAGLASATGTARMEQAAEPEPEPAGREEEPGAADEEDEG